MTHAHARVAVDFNDLKTGFQSGKAAALSDWSFRKEQAEFEKVVNRLRARKWAKENPEQRREIALRYSRKPEVGDHQLALARQRRLERHRAKAEVFACVECRVEFCLVKPKAGGRPRKYCTTACMLRERYQRITPGARRIKRMGNQP